MEYSPRYARFRTLLRTIREEAELSQAALAKKLGKPQSFVCKSEIGERLIDFLETLDFCAACNVSVARFAERLCHGGSEPKAAGNKNGAADRSPRETGVWIEGEVMSFEQGIAALTACMTFIGLLFVAWQIRLSTKQRTLDSLVKIYDINRALVSLGFSHPHLFAIIDDGQDSESARERRYLQLWLNQFALIHTYLKNSVFDRELNESLIRDLTDFMTTTRMSHHWKTHGEFYPASFQAMVNDILKKNEPHKAAHVKLP